MDNFVAFLTFVLFVIFTASFTVDESVTSADSDILLPANNVTSDSVDTSAANNRTEPGKIAKNSTPHTNFSRFHAVNRHFNDKHPRRCKKIGKRRRTCRKYSQYRISSGNEAEESNEDPSNWLKIKRDHGSSVDRKNHRNNDENVIKTKHVIDREKLKNLIGEKKQKSREEVSVLMKSIRKFLKHNFD